MASSAKPKPKGRKRKGSGKSDAKPDTGASAEALLGRLDEVVHELETGDLPLEQALASFEEGIKLVRDGEALLASVEQRIEILLGDDRVEPFADDEDYAEEHDES